MKHMYVGGKYMHFMNANNSLSGLPPGFVTFSLGHQPVEPDWPFI
jgi:hypothetical protein